MTLTCHLCPFLYHSDGSHSSGWTEWPLAVLLRIRLQIDQIPKVSVFEKKKWTGNEGLVLRYCDIIVHPSVI